MTFTPVPVIVHDAGKPVPVQLKVTLVGVFFRTLDATAVKVFKVTEEEEVHAPPV